MAEFSGINLTATDIERLVKVASEEKQKIMKMVAAPMRRIEGEGEHLEKQGTASPEFGGGGCFLGLLVCG